MDVGDVQDEIEQAETREREREDASRGQELLRTINFGLQVQAFMNGPIGQKIIADAADEMQGLMEQYVTLDPEEASDRKQMRELKLQMGLIESPLAYLTRYLTEAKEAEDEFHEGQVPH